MKMPRKKEYTWLHTDRVLSHFGTTRSETIAGMAVHIKFKMDASIDTEGIPKSFRKGAFGDQEFAEIYAPMKDFGPDEQNCSATIRPASGL
jgi:hypothetical protein